MFKFQAGFALIQPFLLHSVEKRGDQSRFKSSGLYTYWAGAGTSTSASAARCEIETTPRPFLLSTFCSMHYTRPKPVMAIVSRGENEIERNTTAVLCVYLY